MDGVARQPRQVETRQLAAWGINAPDDNLAVFHKFYTPDPNLASTWVEDVDQREFREIKPASSLGVVCRNSTTKYHLVVYTQGNGTVTHAMWSGNSTTGGWTYWNNRGGSFVGDPVLVAVGDERVDFFGIGVDFAMYHFTWSASVGYSSLDSLGGSFASIPSVLVSSDGGRIDAIVLGRDGRIKHRALKGSVWGPDWEDLGGFGNSAPVAVYMDSVPQHVALFVIGRNGDLTFTTWTVDDSVSWRGLEPWKSIGGNFSVNYGTSP